MAAASSGSTRIVKAILEKGINNINETMDKTKTHVVHEAAKTGNLEILKVNLVEIIIEELNNINHTYVCINQFK